MQGQRHRLIALTGMVAAMLMTGELRAAEDGFTFEGMTYRTDVEIKGVSGNGKLMAAIGGGGGADKGYDLAKINVISLATSAKFNEAEKLRDTDAKTSAAAYKRAIAEINNPRLKLLAELRAIGPTETDGKYSEALGYFLEVYAALPTDAIWSFHPTKLPSAGSTMLGESAEKVAAAAKAAKTDEARKNLKSLQLEILTKAGDDEGAKRLAQEMTTGVAEDPAKTAETPKSASPVLNDIEGALARKDYPAALQNADAVLLIATGDTAIQAFLLKAKAYDEMNKPELAVATLLRIPAYFPGYERNAAVVWQAAELQKRAGHPDEAKALLQEIAERYPESPEAVRIKNP